MVELNTRDLIVLRAITEWNNTEAKKVKHLPESARVSSVSPCTVTKLCGKSEPYGGAVNKFIRDHKLPIELADDSEQIYRSTKKLSAAKLITINTHPNRYAQTKLGESVINALSLDPKSWPGSITVDGANVILPALHGR
jgi:hypothetical protein